MKLEISILLMKLVAVSPRGLFRKIKWIFFDINGSSCPIYFISPFNKIFSPKKLRAMKNAANWSLIYHHTEICIAEDFFNWYIAFAIYQLKLSDISRSTFFSHVDQLFDIRNLCYVVRNDSWVKNQIKLTSAQYEANITDFNFHN